MFKRKLCVAAQLSLNLLTISRSVVYCRPLLFVYVFPSRSPLDWFLCAPCHPAGDKWCCSPLWQPINTSFCFIFRCCVCKRAPLFMFVYVFGRKLSLSRWLIALLIRTSSSCRLCWFKQSNMRVLAWASRAPVPFFLWEQLAQAAAQRSEQGWVGVTLE